MTSTVKIGGLEEKANEKAVEQLRLQNKRCFDCDVLVVQYAVLDFGIWVCTNCAGIHRELQHKVKSPTLSIFKADEIKYLETKGNDVVNSIYRAKWNQREYPRPDGSDRERMLRFIEKIFKEKAWYSGEAAAAAQPSRPALNQSSSTVLLQPPSSTRSRPLGHANSSGSLPSIGNLSIGTPPPSQSRQTPPPSGNTLISWDDVFSSPPQQQQQQPQHQQESSMSPTNPFVDPFADLLGPSQPPVISQNTTISQTSQNPFNLAPPPQTLHPSQPPQQGVQNFETLPSPSLLQRREQRQTQNFSSTPPTADPFDIFNNPTHNSTNNGNNTPPKQTQQQQNSDPFDMFSGSSNSNRQPQNSRPMSMMISSPPAATASSPKQTRPASMIIPPPSNEPRCPVCNRKFVYGTNNNEINTHVDKCLNAGGQLGPDKVVEDEAPSTTDKPNRPRKADHDVIPRGVSRTGTISVKRGDTSPEPWTEWFDLSKQEWYYGAIDRKEAEEVLRKFDQESFLLRKSSIKDAFAVSFYKPKGDKMIHSLIVRRSDGWAFENSTRVYGTVVDLVKTSPETKGLKPPPKNVVTLDR